MNALESINFFIIFNIHDHPKSFLILWSFPSAYIEIKYVISVVQIYGNVFCQISQNLSLSKPLMFDVVSIIIGK